MFTRPRPPADLSAEAALRAACTGAASLPLRDWLRLLRPEALTPRRLSLPGAEGAGERGEG